MINSTEEKIEESSNQNLSENEEFRVEKNTQKHPLFSVKKDSQPEYSKEKEEISPQEKNTPSLEDTLFAKNESLHLEKNESPDENPQGKGLGIYERDHSKIKPFQEKEDFEEEKETPLKKEPEEFVKKEKQVEESEAIGDKKTQKFPDRETYELVAKLKKQLISSRQISERIQAVQELGKLQIPLAFRALKDAWSEMNIVTREEYCRVLAQWQGKQRADAMDIIIHHVLKDKARTVRRNGAELLGNMAGEDGQAGQKESVDKASVILRKVLLNDDSRTVREKAIIGLAALGDKENLDLIARSLGDPYQTVRIQAVKAFETLDAHEHVKKLIQFYFREKYDSVRLPIMETVLALDKDKAAPFLKRIFLDRTKMAGPFQITKGMRFFATKLLKNYASDPDHQKDIAKCLGQGFLTEKDYSIRMEILHSLARFNPENEVVRKIFLVALKNQNSKMRELAQEIWKKPYGE